MQHSVRKKAKKNRERTQESIIPHSTTPESFFRSVRKSVGGLQAVRLTLLTEVGRQFLHHVPEKIFSRCGKSFFSHRKKIFSAAKKKFSHKKKLTLSALILREAWVSLFKYRTSIFNKIRVRISRSEARLHPSTLSMKYASWARHHGQSWSTSCPQ